ncbi:MAG TPA: hypothetical protein VEC19_14580 [Usitatibacter sp.]|nr:hypothetical protein [Usitatibacter sp.]
MNRKWTLALAVGALVAGATPAMAQRYVDEYTVRLARSPDWNVAAADGFCRLRLYVDDRARIELRGDQVVVRTESGRRSFDQGSVCNQPLPLHRVDDFRVTTERGRGAVVDVSVPAPRNGFTGALTIHDPQNDGDEYDVVVAWRNPAVRPVEPLAAAGPLPVFDEIRACQDRVRGDFIARNSDTDAYLEFTSPPVRDAMGPNRDRIRGEAWARNRVEARPVTYECVVNERTNRVVTANYEVRPRSRYSSLY